MSKSKPITVKEAEIIEKRIRKQNQGKKPVALGSTLSKIGKKYPVDVVSENNKYH